MNKHWDLPKIWLASGSPRRRELLSQIGIHFDTLKVDVDESVLPDETPHAYVKRLAEAKAQAGWACEQVQAQPRPVLGADTTVVINQQILGKPRDKQHAQAMLQLLSGQTHQVMTAIAFCFQSNQTQAQCQSQVVTTEVTFREISPEEIAAYWETGEPADKAGGYGIQGLGGRFVTRINGSYPAVVGLPLADTEILLRAITSR